MTRIQRRRWATVHPPLGSSLLGASNLGAHHWLGRYRRNRFAQVLAEPYKAITSISGKPLILPEVGAPETGGSKATWITDALQTQLPLMFPQVRALVWFDVKKEENWPLSSSSAAYSAWTTGSRLAAYTSSFQP